MIDPQKILSKFPNSVPRYTSYPTAPHFQEGLGKSLIDKALASIQRDERISIYVHIPYCDRLCWFCGCNTKHTLKYDPVAAYIGSLIDEITLMGEKLDFKPIVGHLHFGGGSPSMVQSADFKRLRSALDKVFSFDDQSEISVEIDPSDVTDDTMNGLKILGLTRASIGVQDFDPRVQAAINRPQTYEQTRDVVERLRSIGIGSLNIDALYGLPLQSEDTVQKTIDQVIALRPDRVALFGYAHVPWMKKHQKLIKEADLPDTMQRFAQCGLAEVALLEAGYEKIGFDHFALKQDSMAIAARSGNLHRNFQGYTTDACKTMLGLGASSIGKFDGGYIQNTVATSQYRACVANGELPAAKGFELSKDDAIRGWMIGRLMCEFEIDLDQLASRYGEMAKPYLEEIQILASQEQDGLCKIAGSKFIVPEHAQPFVRIVAARLDAYLADSNFRYSKAV